jgi:NADPH:quinone reductase-like Zn-dependent oxidoreductase
MAGGVEISSSSLGRLCDERRTAICREVAAEVLSMVSVGSVRPVLDTTFAFGDLAAAHRRFADPDRIGKVVVTTEISKPDAEQRNQLFA